MNSRILRRYVIGRRFCATCYVTSQDSASNDLFREELIQEFLEIYSRVLDPARSCRKEKFLKKGKLATRIVRVDYGPFEDAYKKAD
jgi:hypothetical protein